MSLVVIKPGAMALADWQQIYAGSGFKLSAEARTDVDATVEKVNRDLENTPMLW